jgi:hypothetical protein
LIALRIIEHGMVFRMKQNDLKRHVFHGGEHFPLPVFAPRVEEELARLVSGWVKHLSYQCK